jgi:DNA invertase Pin-like site-specific DNA recombinase
MLRIGYVRLRDAEQASQLKAAGCHVVRAEEPDGLDEAGVLFSILDFIASGDELVVIRLDQLGRSARQVLEVVERLESRGATLTILEPQLSTERDGGRALRAALEAVAALEPIPLTRRRRPTAAREILELQRAGVGPVEIARRLGVSRMTVWRKLKAVSAA